MSHPTRTSPRTWILFPICALGFLLVTDALRVRRVEYVSGVAGPPAAETPGSPWRPRLIVPGHHNESFEWLDLTRQMFSRGELRVRHVDFENNPDGREVFASSPYRWWLGFVAWSHHAVCGSRIDRSLEWAALYADPLLLLLAGVATTVFVARRFGVLAAAFLALGLATLFPFAAEFLPGVPDDHGLAQVSVLWSVLLLLAGIRERADDAAVPGRARQGWFFSAGVIGGIGLWVDVAHEAPILVGIALGALIAAWVARTAKGSHPAAQPMALPWRSWALGGALTCLFAYAAEFFPDHMGPWEFHAIHPLFGLAWLGGGEALARWVSWVQGGSPPWRGIRSVSSSLIGLAALAALPVAMGLTHSLGFLSVDLPSMRLSLLPGGPAAANLWAWLLQNGFTPSVWATVLPLVLVVPPVALLACGAFSPAHRMAIALALGPVLVAVGFAFRQIGWWSGFDGVLLALVVATASAVRHSHRRRLVAWVSGVLAAAALLPGAVQLWPAAGERVGDGLTGTEVDSLVERDLAFWLQKHVGSAGAVVLAPPNATAALYYYGGMRGLGTFGWENRDGLVAAVRIASATTPEEAQLLISRRGITHIIMPQWDPYLDAYAKMGEGQLEGTFLERLHRWVLPPWLRPVPYLGPTIPGFEGRSVTILEVVEEQDAASAASQLAEYFVDMGQMDLAVNAAQALRRFPADLGALLARAQVAIAQGDAEEFSRTEEVLLRRISSGADRDLPWDQRVGLAIVLAQAHRVDLARARLKQCLDEVDDERLRSLSTSTLYRLQVLRKALGLEIKDSHFQETSMDLLPADLRSRLQK